METQIVSTASQAPRSTQPSVPGAVLPSTLADCASSLNKDDLVVFLIAIVRGMCGFMYSGDARWLSLHTAGLWLVEAGYDPDVVEEVLSRVNEYGRLQVAGNPIMSILFDEH